MPGFRIHFYITEISSKHQSSFLFSSKAELRLLLTIFNWLKNFSQYFLMFVYKVELLQHVYMKRNDKFYWSVKKLSFDYLLASLGIIFQPTIFHNL